MFRYGPIPEIVKKGGLLLINEINFLPERVATIIYSLLDGRREIALMEHNGEVIRAHRGKGLCWCKEKNCDDKRVLIVGDMNPGYLGTRELNAAFRNRFGVQLVWDYDRGVEEALIPSAGLLDLMWDLREQVKTEQFSTPVSTNMGMEFVRITRLMGYDFAVMNFVNHYPEEERTPLGHLFEAFSKRIIDTIAMKEETEEERDNRRLAAKIGDFDPEWLVYGVDWVWEDDAETKAIMAANQAMVDADQAN